MPGCSGWDRGHDLYPPKEGGGGAGAGGIGGGVGALGSGCRWGCTSGQTSEPGGFGACCRGGMFARTDWQRRVAVFRGRMRVQEVWAWEGLGSGLHFSLEMRRGPGAVWRCDAVTNS